MNAADAGKLGPVLATLLVASGMIGSGIYLLPASLAAFGSVSILGWALAVTGAALMAAVFSWLSILRPDGPGFFPMITETLGPGVGFITGLLYWCPVGSLGGALAVTGYLSFFIPQIANGVGATLATLAVLWIFIGANMIGARFVARFGGWTLGVGLVPILIVAIGGWLSFHPAIFAASWNVSGHSAWLAVPQSATIAFLALSGVESALIIAPLVRQPARNVPLASFAGLLLAGSVYLLASGVIMGIVPATALAKSSAPFADAMRPLLGASVAGLVAFCAMMRSAGCLGSNILVIVETAESDAVMGQIRPGRPLRRPEVAPKLNLIVTGVLMSAAVVASTSPTLGRQFTIIADLTVVFSMFAYLGVCFALLRMSRDAPLRRRGQIRVIAIAAALFCCGVIAASETDLLIWSACGIGAAVLVWLPVRWRRRRLA